MDFLKKLTKPTFYVGSYAQGVVQFRCKKSLKVNAPAEGTAILPGGARLDLTIMVTDAAGEVYAGRPTGPAPAVVKLEQTFLPDARSSKEQLFYKPSENDLTRHARTYAVRCKEFHNFKGVTAEISRAGALVVLTGPVDPGIDTVIHVALDDDDLQPMDIEATVEWCQQRDEKSWVASLAFKELSPENDAILAKFLEDLKYRLPGSRPSPF